MKVDIEKPQDWARRLTITVPADRVQQERTQVASQYAKRARLKGFRKGKVPPSHVEKQFGPAIEQDTVERVIQAAYQEALDAHSFNPISQASVENVDYQPGAELTFNVEFEVRPDVALDRLGGFTVKEPSSAVKEGDVERVIGRLREQAATWTPLEASPDEGDRAKVEITPLHEDDEDPEPREYQVVLGGGEILEEIDQAIRTLSPGEESEFTVDLPGDDGEENHRIRLKLLEAEHPELPEADDEFATGLGDFESMDDLQSRVRDDLSDEAEREADREVRHRLLEQILEANPFDVPPSLVDQYLDGLLQAPPDADPGEVATAKEQARPAAEQAVRRMLVIERVAELEELHATDDDVNARVAEIAEQNEMETAAVRRQLAASGRLQHLASDLTEKRVFDYLKSLSTIEKEAD